MRSFKEDYLNGVESLKEFYRISPYEYEVKELVEGRKAFPVPRKTLTQVLHRQYENLPVSEAVRKNLELLANENCYTLTTGHQPVLFGGPMFVIYKALTVIRLAEEFKSLMPECDFVPVFWMASEDHDAAELNHTWFDYRAKTVYSEKIFGAVGRHILTDLIKIGYPPPEKDFRLRSEWRPGVKWADAFRATLNRYLGDEGLIILDPDVAELKYAFFSVAEPEFSARPTEKIILDTSERLSQKGYTIQFKPRPVNLFYLTDQNRGRIIFNSDSGTFSVDKTELTFTRKHLIDHLSEHPDCISPNAALRPLYQELILPNLVYVGGWGEIAYHMQLKGVYEHFGVHQPLILPRISALLFTAKQINEWEELGFELEDLLRPDQYYKDRVLKEVWKDDGINMWTEELSAIFDRLHEYVGNLTPQQQINVRGQLAKNVHFAEKLKKKMVKMTLRKHPLKYQPVLRAKDAIQPDGVIQERFLHPAAFPDKSSEEVIERVKKVLHAFDYDLQYIEV